MFVERSGEDAREGRNRALSKYIFSVVLQLPFPCLKKTGGWRPVIYLSGLNTHLHIPSFKRKTAKIIQESLDQGQWMTSIDLPDVYFHIAMALWTHKYLRCMVLGEVYQFLFLPFCLAIAPREFTAVAQGIEDSLESVGYVS